MVWRMLSLSINTDCWDKNVIGRSLEKCGHRSPQNISANVVRVDSSVSELCVQWKPDKNSVITAYMITISGNNYHVSAVNINTVHVAVSYWLAINILP